MLLMYILIVSDAKPSLEDLDDICTIVMKECGIDWKHLGFQLHISSKFLRMWEQKAQGYPFVACFMMLEWWLENIPTATWQSLITGVSNCVSQSTHSGRKFLFVLSGNILFFI